MRHEGTRDGNTLALTTGQLVWPMFRLRRELHELEEVGDALAPFGGLELAELQ